VVVSRDDRHEEDDGGGSDLVRIFLSPEQPPAEQKSALSLKLGNGDIVTAISIQFFYVSGEVKSPGSYPITPGLTVLKAVSVAGGLTKFGSKGKVEILRRGGGGETERIKLDLGDIEGGKKPDVPLEPEDIIKVGKRVF
jgi:protein involved in polysaccharide export with SLBB domain